MATAADDEDAEPIRFSVPPTEVEGRADLLKPWGNYLEKQLGRPVVFVQQGSRRAADLLHDNTIDFAWLAGYHYVRFQAWMTPVAVPVVEESGWDPFVIVSDRDAESRALADLRGRLFAYPDAAAYLGTRFALVQQKEHPEAFFGKSFATGSPRDVIEAVAVGLAQAGTLDAHAWNALARRNPALTARTRVIARLSGLGAPPPVAARRSISPRELASVRDALLRMARDPEGKAVLDTLNLKGFAAPAAGQFDGVARMVRTVNGF